VRIRKKGGRKSDLHQGKKKEGGGGKETRGPTLRNPRALEKKRRWKYLEGERKLGKTHANVTISKT